MASSVLSAVKIDYPSSDGRPVAESSVHFACLTEACFGLQRHFRHRRDVFVAGNLLIYYEEGNIKARVAPDVFVVVGVGNHDRTSYLLWEEGKVPSFVLEITSRGTRNEDQGKKRELYGRLGVTEYWQYDPGGEWLAPPLRGMELVGGQYQELPAWELADGTLVMSSGVLGLEVLAGASGLRFHDPQTGRYILTRAETEAAWERAEQERERAEQAHEQEKRARVREASARRAAEVRVAELEAALSRERSRGS